MTASGKCAAIGVSTSPLSDELLGHRLDDEIAALDAVQRVADDEARRRRPAAAASSRRPSRSAVASAASTRARVSLGMAREAVHAIARERVLGGDLRAHQPGTDDDDIHQRRS